MTARWTREDKRGTPGGRNVEEKEMFRDSTIPRVLPRTPEEIRLAAAWWAWDALEHCPGDRDMVELALSMLGLDRPALEQQQAREEPCWPYAGTSRGLNIHLKSYTYPCAGCAEIQTERRRSTAVRLDIKHDGVIA